MGGRASRDSAVETKLTNDVGRDVLWTRDLHVADRIPKQPYEVASTSSSLCHWARLDHLPKVTCWGSHPGLCGSKRTLSSRLFGKLGNTFLMDDKEQGYCSMNTEHGD